MKAEVEITENGREWLVSVYDTSTVGRRDEYVIEAEATSVREAIALTGALLWELMKAYHPRLRQRRKKAA